MTCENPLCDSDIAKQLLLVEQLYSESLKTELDHLKQEYLKLQDIIQQKNNLIEQLQTQLADQEVEHFGRIQTKELEVEALLLRWVESLKQKIRGK